MNAAALMALFRARVKAEGPSAPFFVEQRDAYSQVVLPAESRLVPAVDADDGYAATTPILLGGPLPVVQFIADDHGIVGGTISKKAEHDDADDIHRAEQKKMYRKRAQIIKETGTYPGASTDQLVANANQDQNDDR